MKNYTTTRPFAAALVAFSLLVVGPAMAHSGPRTTGPAAKRTHAAPQPDCCATAAPATQKAPASKMLAAAVAPAATAPAEVAAPQVVQLRGIVLRPDGQPCAGASVYPAGAPRQLVVTDAKGAFTLPVPASAAVSLRVEYFGEGSSRVEVPAPGKEPLRITLGQ